MFLVEINSKLEFSLKYSFNSGKTFIWWFKKSSKFLLDSAEVLIIGNVINNVVIQKIVVKFLKISLFSPLLCIYIIIQFNQKSSLILQKSFILFFLVV